MNVLIVGVGEIGSSLARLIEESGHFNVFKKDFEPLELKEKIEVMHICIPYTEKFEQIVEEYINQYKPSLTIIESTVRPGTTEKIHKKTKAKIVHSPVRGKHPDLTGGMKKFVKFIGPVDQESAKLAEEHYSKLGIRTETLDSPIQSEVGKLLSTTYYAMNIAFHQEMYRICEKYGADFLQAVTRFNATCTMDINHKIPRPLMFPGLLSGHCLLPNIEILKEDVDSMFLDAIEKSNEKNEADFNDNAKKKLLDRIKESVLKTKHKL